MKRWFLLLVVSTVALCPTGVALAGAARHAVAVKVTVTFTDTRFGLSRIGVDAGKATFLVVNHGQKPHVLAITGPGLKGVRTPRVAPGKSAKLTVTLSKGAYMLADPLAHTYIVRWLVVSPAVNVSSTGNGSVVTPLTAPPAGMECD